MSDRAQADHAASGQAPAGVGDIDAMALAERSPAAQVVPQLLGGDPGVIELEALAPALQMGGAVGAAMHPGSPQDGVQERADGALAVGARHLHRGEGPLRVRALRQGRLQALQAEGDAARREGLQQVVEIDGIGQRQKHSLRRGWPALAPAAAPPGGSGGGGGERVVPKRRLPGGAPDRPGSPPFPYSLSLSLSLSLSVCLSLSV